MKRATSSLRGVLMPARQSVFRRHCQPQAKRSLFLRHCDPELAEGEAIFVPHRLLQSLRSLAMTATDLPCAMTGLLLLTAAFCFVTPAFAVEPLLVDNFEGPAIQNTLGNRANVFIRAPSRAMTSRRQETVNGKESQVLLLRFDKQEEGGPYGGGGWCGYYTLLKKGSEYLDASQYSKISFWVRGEEGGEVFLMGVADRHWDEVGDSVKSEPIGKYLSGGKVTTEWQQANVPLDYFFVDRAKLSSVAFVFDTGAGAGTIYVDDLKLE